jgi:Tfp pilus assembly protein PilN
MKHPFQKKVASGASFLPEDYVAQKIELRANVLCLSLFGLVMFGVIGAFFVTNRQWIKVRQEQAAITVEYTQQATKIEQLKTLEMQKAEMLAKAEITTALIEKVPRSVLLGELVTRMPEEITLLDLKLESKRLKDDPLPGLGKPGAGAPRIRSIQAGAQPSVAPAPGKPALPEPSRIRAPRFEYKLTITGVSKRNNEIADYIASLKDCTLLDKVDLRHIKEKNIDKVEMREFVIEAVIRPDADARSLEPVKDLQQGTAAISSDPTPGTASVDESAAPPANPGKE